MDTMDLTTLQDSEREVVRARANREELVERIAHAVPDDGRREPMEGLWLFRASEPTDLVHGTFVPGFCVIAQGSKEIVAGDRRYQYDPYHYLLASVQLPVISQVTVASKERPYLSLRLTLDSSLMSSVMVEAGHATPRSGADVSAFDVSPLSADLLDAAVRLIRLLDSPAESSVLAPLVTREIMYRLLTGAQGARLRHIAVINGRSHRIAKAVKRLHKDFRQSTPVESLAEELGMSVSSFHHHFKAVTGMSPLRFQKQLQLQEARRLILSEDLDAATAGYRVGYNDASHFNREYKKLFGDPPIRDVARLREAQRLSAG